VLGNAEAYQGYMNMLGKLMGAEVIAVDYGLAPENPYPIALDQIELVWRELLSEGLDPSKTAFVGDSAGGNLALVSALRFAKSKIDQPACLALFSSPLDATYGGESYADNEESDVLLTNHKLHYFLDSYVQGHDKTDPLVSPVRAELNGLAPDHDWVASEELLLSDALTVAKNAKRDGVECEIVAGEGMWHNWPLFYRHVPEARQFNQKLANSSFQRQNREVS
jgi:epsilon-lactone hydrolase